MKHNRKFQNTLRMSKSMLWMLGLMFCSTFSFANSPSGSATNFEKASSDINAQEEFNVTGTVVDANNIPLIGATVLLKDSNVGTVTDIDGKFSLTVPSEESVLMITYTGYVGQEIPVGTLRDFVITMAEDATVLDEVVVVGYGIAKKETLTGAVEQVKAKAFEDLAVGSPALALQGRTPGLVVTRNSSRPGDEGVEFLIRGETSVNGIEPMIIIDGIPAINSNSFNDMNPNDIESISVLKGGSASIYGARAAGGVILVTTKKGRGGVKVDISSVMRMGTIGIRPPSPTMEEYGQLYLAAVNEDIAIGKPPRYFFWSDLATVERIASGEEGFYDLPINGNIWLGNSSKVDEMFGNSFSQQHNISISGGTDHSNFRISGGFDENVGGLIVADDSKDRFNFIASYGVDLSKRLKVNTNVSYFHTHFSGPAEGLAREAATWDAPLFPTYNPDGQYYANFGGVNITGDRNAVAHVIDGGRINKTIEQLKLSGQTTYKITNDLSIVGSASISKQNSNFQQYQVAVPLYSWQGGFSNNINNTNFIEEGTGPANTDGDILYQNYRAVLNYSRGFGNHNISGIAGVEAEKWDYDEFNIRRIGFVDYGVYDINLGSTDNVTTSGGGTKRGFHGYIGRINYDYNKKYLLEIQGRWDGASPFYEGFKRLPFGSISAGWVISSEDFLKDSNLITFLKLRGGYGEVGSTSGVPDFGYLSTVQFGTQVFGSAAQLQQTSRASNATNRTTTWERVVNKEIGLDFRLLRDKIYGSVDFYQKDNVGMLVRGIVPDVFGTATPFTNIGTLETNGWEVLLGWRDKIGDLQIGVSANMSDSRNEITEYAGAQTIFENLNSADAGRNILGKPINSFYLWETDGYFDTQAEVDAYYESLDAGGILPAQTSNDALRPGDMRVVDSNGDGILNNDDLTYHGDALTHYVYGFNFDLEYKNFDVTGFFQGVLNHNIYRTGYFAQPFQAEWQNQSNTWLGRTWTEDNRDAEFPRLTTQRGISTWNYRSKDHILQNNRYLRMKSLIIGYNIRGLNLVNKQIDNIRVYVSGNDLFEFTTVKDGYDPEFRASTNTSAYPFMRSWAVGLKVSL